MGPEVEAWPAVVTGSLIATMAFMLRIAVLLGARPGGVDTWYYLASAEALRRRFRLPVRLPQYLLHESSESYPPGFIVALAILPRRWLARWFWTVAPFADAMNCSFLFFVTYRLTDSQSTAAVAGIIYATMPQLVSETRSLNPRAPAVLVASVAMMLVLRSLVPPESASSLQLGAAPWGIAAAAVVLIAILALTHTTTLVAFAFSNATLAVVFVDPRPVLFVVAGVALASLLPGRLYGRVLKNHLHSARFWRRNIAFRNAHPIDDSPLYTTDASSRPGRRAGWDRGIMRPLIRLAAENPFMLPLLLTPLPIAGLEWWGQRMYWWAFAVLAFVAATTFVPPLRIFGPGRLYLKSSIFPTAFTLALATSGITGLASPLGLAVAGALAASLASVVAFLLVVRRRTTEHTAIVPADLAAISADLSVQEGDGVLVLPTMYSDYLCYASGKRVLWGGHSGDLLRFEDVFPIFRKPLEDLVAEYGLAFVLLDEAYVTPARVGLEPYLVVVARRGTFALYRTRASSGPGRPLAHVEEMGLRRRPA